MRQAPLGHDRAAAGDDAGHPVGSQRHILQAYAGVNGKVVHALLGLLDQGVAEQFPGKVLGLAIDLLQRLVDRHGADRHRRVAQDPLAGLVDVLAGGEVHQGVAAPARGPHQLLDFLLDRGGDRRVADVGVDLHPEVAADDHRLQFRMVDVGRDDGAAAGHLIAHELGGDRLGDRGPEGLAGVASQQLLVARIFAQLLQAVVLADRDELHLRGDGTRPGVVHLRDVGPGLRAARRADVLETQGGQFGVFGAGAAVVRARAVQPLGVAALVDPGATPIRQTPGQVDGRFRIGVRAGGVINRDRRILFRHSGSHGRTLRDLAQWHADIRPRSLDIALPGVRERAGNLRGDRGGLANKRLGNGTHKTTSAALRGRGARTARSPGSTPTE